MRPPSPVMIYTGHLPASADSLPVSRCRRDRATILLPTSLSPLSFREICRPRPQPIRSSAAPVKFTRQVCCCVYCPSRHEEGCRAREGRKNAAVASRVRQGVSMSERDNGVKKKKKKEKKPRTRSRRGGGGGGGREAESKGRLGPDGYTQGP